MAPSRSLGRAPRPPSAPGHSPAPFSRRAACNSSARAIFAIRRPPCENVPQGASLFFFCFCYMPPFEGCRATCFFPVWEKNAKGTILFYFIFFISKRTRRETQWHCRTDLVLYTLCGNKGRKKEASVRVAISPRVRTWIVHCAYVCVSVECVFVSHVLPGMTP